jgi:hypothetical protein
LVRLVCSPSAVDRCTGKLVLTTRRRPPARSGGARARRTLRLGTAGFSIASGKGERIRVKLSPRAHRLLARHRRLRVTARASAHDGQLRNSVTKSSLLLKLTRRG